MDRDKIIELLKGEDPNTVKLGELLAEHHDMELSLANSQLIKFGEFLQEYTKYSVFDFKPNDLLSLTGAPFGLKVLVHFKEQSRIIKDRFKQINQDLIFHTFGFMIDCVTDPSTSHFITLKFYKR